MRVTASYGMGVFQERRFFETHFGRFFDFESWNQLFLLLWTWWHALTTHLSPPTRSRDPLRSHNPTALLRTLTLSSPTCNTQTTRTNWETAEMPHMGSTRLLQPVRRKPQARRVRFSTQFCSCMSGASKNRLLGWTNGKPANQVFKMQPFVSRIPPVSSHRCGECGYLLGLLTAPILGCIQWCIIAIVVLLPVVMIKRLLLMSCGGVVVRALTRVCTCTSTTSSTLCSPSHTIYTCLGCVKAALFADAKCCCWKNHELEEHINKTPRTASFRVFRRY